MLELIGVGGFFALDFLKTFIGKSMRFFSQNNASLLEELELLEGPKTNLDQFSHNFFNNIPWKLHPLYGK